MPSRSGRHLRRRDRPGVRLIGWLLVALLAGATAGAVGVSAYDATTDDAAEVSTDDTTTAPPDPGVAVLVPEPGPITLAFVGDIYADRTLATRLADQPDGFVGPFAEILHDADLVVGNVEAAITTSGSPLDKEYTFRAPPEILDALAAGGFDVVSVANNHGMDYGVEGFEDTLAIARSHPADMVIGLGADEDEAYAPFVREVGGQSVAVIAATQVIGAQFISSWTAKDDQPGLASAKRVDRLVEEVEAAAADYDTVVVFLHWGVETELCPTVSQQELAGALADAGADVVVGSHAHRVQGGGMLGDTVVHYGLGNFLFGAVSEESAESGVFLVTVQGHEVLDYEWIPGRIDTERVPQPLDGDDADAAVARWTDRRTCTDLVP